MLNFCTLKSVSITPYTSVITFLQKILATRKKMGLLSPLLFLGVGDSQLTTVAWSSSCAKSSNISSQISLAASQCRTGLTSSCLSFLNPPRKELT